VNLYSEDFYGVVKQHLASGGILAQWVPVDFARGEIWRRMMRALQHSFPHVSLWVTNRMEGIAIASDHPLAIDVGELAQRMQSPGVGQDLHEIGITSAAHLLGTFVAADTDLGRLVREGPGVTDDYPTIEYHNLIPVGPITFDDLVSGSEPVSREVVGPKDPAQLATGRIVVEAIWRAHEASVKGDSAAMKRWIATGLALEPDNQYLEFLRSLTLASN
jgi:spermidine synthase